MQSKTIIMCAYCRWFGVLADFVAPFLHEIFKTRHLFVFANDTIAFEPEDNKVIQKVSGTGLPCLQN